ncbi:ABC transporter ATP-binding protein [Geofilum sp. OHC36d9]|uniref:ABC transporter ATP-binding protein n=1 Tax=Geofilum sp. OHC36d9 TaxID=3458413 RepID=UPI004033C7FF
MPDSYLKIVNLDCGYGDGFRLKNISLSLPKGALAGIIGPNGSGKTTLFKGISGNLAVRTGEIWLHHENLNTLKLNAKARKVAVVNQFPDAIDVTVEDYVLMGRLPYREAFQFFEPRHDVVIARKYMRLTGIFNHRKKLMSQLSGGEQQLAAIAQALTQEPELLLMDEPTSHLDITHQVQVLNLIQRLNGEMNLTVLMIIHDLNLAAEYCNYLIMMKDGAIHMKGSPQEVLTYDNIEQVYNTVVVTEINPLSGKPAVFLVSERILKHIKDKYGSLNRD